MINIKKASLFFSLSKRKNKKKKDKIQRQFHGEVRQYQTVFASQPTYSVSDFLTVHKKLNNCIYVRTEGQHSEGILSLDNLYS